MSSVAEVSKKSGRPSTEGVTALAVATAAISHAAPKPSTAKTEPKAVETVTADAVPEAGFAICHLAQVPVDEQSPSTCREVSYAPVSKKART